MPSHSQLIIEGQKVSPVRDSQSRKEPGASSIAKFETAPSNLKVDFFYTDFIRVYHLYKIHN